MTVRVRAGTTVADLDDALAEVGQTVALPAWPGATVGGVLAVGHSGIRHLGWGPVRDTVLEVRYVSAEGAVVKAGGPTVKNVSGFDLCRLLVGSLGTLGLIAEVVLRTRPLPAAERWVSGVADPFRPGRPSEPARPPCCGTAPPPGCCWTAIPTTSPLRPGHRAWPTRPGRPTCRRTGGRCGRGICAPLAGDGRARPCSSAQVGVGVAHASAPQPPPPGRPRGGGAPRADQAPVRPHGPPRPGPRPAGRDDDAGAR